MSDRVDVVMETGNQRDLWCQKLPQQDTSSNGRILIAVHASLVKVKGKNQYVRADWVLREKLFSEK